ncbi:MAG: YkgJ family cysteine cluster protein, partial [Clostridia bacterium]|nr:YkgJ family cysteine cluster protein [Clostridia bacterium]
LAKELDMAPIQVIEKYCEVYVGESSRIPIVRLVPVGPYQICPLLKGNRCSVHNAKPTVCAIFPIGRAFSLPVEEAGNAKFSGKDIQYILQPITCGDKRKEHTVREWLSDFNIPVDDQFFVDWQTSVCRIGACIREIEKTFPKSVMGQIFNLIFASAYVNYITTQDFKEQFDKNIAKVVELVEMLPKKLGDFYKFIKENNEGGDNNDG